MVLRDYTNLKNKQIWGVQRGISPSGLSPLALYADYPFLIRSYAIYKGQGKTLDGITYINSWNECVQAVKEKA